MTDSVIQALFGYFDLDAAFSAAFILAMMGFVEMKDEQKPPEGLSQSADVLSYLCKAGNKAALRRLNELKQFCGHVWSPDRLEGEWKWLRDETPCGSGPSSNPTSHADPGSAKDTSHGDAIQGPPVGTSLGNDALRDWHQPINSGADSVLFGFDNFNDLGMDLSNEMGDIYSSFNDPSLPLTGIDDVDWAEVGKMFHLDQY